MRHVAPRALLLFLLTLGVVLMHQVPMPMHQPGFDSGSGTTARYAASAIPGQHGNNPGHGQADPSATRTAPTPDVTAQADHQQRADQDTDHCGWMLHLCLAILLGALGLLRGGTRRLIRSKPVRPPRYRNPPPRSVRTRPPTPDLYALRVLRL